MLELVLRLHGDFRRSLEPIRVTPLQAGLMLYLHRCADSRVNEAANHLRVRPPTLTDVIQDLVRKKWVIKRQSAEDGRVFRLRLSRRGEAIARTIKEYVIQMETDAESLRPVQPTVSMLG
jgi:DNA-binding MarR family transcriptional regulator